MATMQNGTGSSATMPGAGQNYNYNQIIQLWQEAGGNPEWGPTMAAIALGAESGGNPSAENPSGATGLFQIILSAQSPSFQAQWKGANLKDPLTNARIAVEMLGDGSGISNWGAGTGDAIGTYVQQNGGKPLTPQQAQQFARSGGAPATDAILTSTPVTSTSDNRAGNASGTGPDNPSVTGPTTFAKPEAGVNVKNDQGVDLSAIQQNLLGNVEGELKKYMSGTLVVGGQKVDPATIEQRMNQDYGYQSWMTKIPELYGVMLAAVLGGWNENEVLGAVRNTKWYETTSQNQRAWEQVQSTDPATAQKELDSANEKVLATANQLGVQLSAQELSAIAKAYAQQSATQGGVLGQVSGTSQEWLDQYVVNTVLNIKSSKDDLSKQTAGQSSFATDTTGKGGAANPAGLTGISGQLYNDFLGIAQNYLMYNPNDPSKSLMTQDDILKAVEGYIQHWTGSNSFGSSNLINGSVAAFTQQMIDKAKSTYPSLASAIDAGAQPANYIAPTANYVAQQLGMSSGDINVLDPQWNWIINTPGKDGVAGPVTQDQALQKITNPNFTFTTPDGQVMKYDNTNAALQNAHTLVNGLSAMFQVGGA